MWPGTTEYPVAGLKVEEDDGRRMEVDVKAVLLHHRSVVALSQ